MVPYIVTYTISLTSSLIGVLTRLSLSSVKSRYTWMSYSTNST